MSRLSTRTRFALAAVLLIAPIVVIALILLDQSFKRSQDQVVTGEFATADVVAQSVSQLVEGQWEALTALAATDAISAIGERADEAFILMDAYRASRPPVNGVFYLRNDLNPIAPSGGIDPATLVSVPAFQSAAQAAVQGGQATVSDILIVPDSNVQVIAIMVPVYAAAEASNGDTPPAGAIGAFYSVERLILGFQPAGGFASGSEVAVGLVTANNTLVSLASQTVDDPTAVFQDGDDLDAAILSALGGQRTQSTFHDPSGADRTIVAVPIPIPGGDWAVLVSSPETMEYGPIQSLVERAIVALVAAVLATIILAAFLGDWLARPFRQLAGQAHALSSGGATTAMEATGPSDAAELSRTIREMADRLRAQVRDTESAREEIARQAERLRDLLRRTVRLQEDERRRIASDIHDAVSPLITGALYQTQAVRLASSNGNGGHYANGRPTENGVSGEGETMTGLQEVSDLLERAMRELHDVIFDLRPPDLDDIGIVAALQRHVDQVNRTGLRTTLEVSGDEQRLPPEVRLAIYRIVQEALHNAIRHARADDAVVRIEWLTDKLRVTVQDDGSGFDVENSGRPSGLGLMSMRERAWSIGAALDIVSRPGSGTAIVVERRTDELDLGSDVGSQEEADQLADSADADLDNALYDEVEYAGVDEEQRSS
jgi:signal transduction histidine kinase